MHEKGSDSCLQNNWQSGHSQLFSLMGEDKGIFAKVRPADERKYFPFLHNTHLIYKTHKIAGCSQEQCKTQKALGTCMENESTGTFH